MWRGRQRSKHKKSKCYIGSIPQVCEMYGQGRGHLAKEKKKKSILLKGLKGFSINSPEFSSSVSIPIVAFVHCFYI